MSTEEKAATTLPAIPASPDKSTAAPAADAAAPAAAAAAAPAAAAAAAGDAPFKAFVASEKGAKWELKDWTPVPLTEDDVEVDIICCGVCHSDHSMQQNEWGISKYPMCAGHEGIGTIAVVGNKVKDKKVGDRVGIGWYRSTCGYCEPCLTGNESGCATTLPTPNITSVLAPDQQAGCFARKIRIPSRNCFPIPDGMDAEKTAPLLCGGITVYKPLKDHCVTGQHIGIIGLGGLGHMAVLFAVKMGMIVHVFSHSDSKKELAMQLGASSYTNFTDKEAMKGKERSCHAIISTPGVHVDFTPFLGDGGGLTGALKVNGKLILVGAPEGAESTKNCLPQLPIIFFQYQIIGSATGGLAKHQEMIRFAADHKVECMVEVFDFTEINEAMTHLMDGKVRFRAVLKWDHKK